VCLPLSEMSRELVLARANSLLSDEETLRKVNCARNDMQCQSSARVAANILEECLVGTSARDAGYGKGVTGS
jgi:hypothetical protein